MAKQKFNKHWDSEKFIGKHESEDLRNKRAQKKFRARQKERYSQEDKENWTDIVRLDKEV